MRFLFGSPAHNSHVQNMALALAEAGALGALHVGWVDHYRWAWLREARGLAGRVVPRLDRELGRRRMAVVPDEVVYQHRPWEIARTAAARLGLDARMQDWLWERSEHQLDRACARLLARGTFDAFLGLEHGCLRALRAARRLGRRRVMAFLSPHHATRARWVDAEYQRFPELETPASRRLLALAGARDQRRDDEAAEAEVVVANSEFTARSLREGGVPARRVATVLLGCPPALPEGALPAAPATPLRFVYAGPVSVRKGAHYLLQAWRRLAPGRAAELHFYGAPLLPPAVLEQGGAGVVFHGSVPWHALEEGYRQGALLVFPSLCDAFGLVVAEALANGLPVLTTQNVGAADLVEEGRSGFVVPPRDPDAIAARLDWCLSHPEELRAMRPHALAAARGWTWGDFRLRFREELWRRLDAPAFAPTGAG